ncbi:hypothetical protein MLD38_020649 [Melastoma candidum]|uniref:Uncharacterized protein n=1 Tax=Melastoma candidum TaxID=119954 RepID=A0ACB9QDX4_9MYRT|nr:hypothetical protein MLD38_020649 [Melastoma candidum]
MEGEDGRLTVSLLPERSADNGGIGIGIVDSDLTSSSESTVTPLVIFSTFVAVCGSFVTGCASAYSSPAESGIRDDLGISLAAYSLFGSILTVGGIAAALVNGWITDLIGRKRALWLSEAFSAVGWLLIVFAKNAWWLDIGRLLIGLGIGIICYVVPIYIAEITPKGVRGAFTALDQFSISCGFSVTYFVGTVVSWRLLALVGFVPCVVQVIGLFFIPESPRWLVKVGREKEFEAVLQRLRGKNADTTQEADEIRDYTRTFEEQSRSRFLDLFQRRYVKALTIGVGLMILQQLGGVNAFAYYSGSIFESADFSSTLGTQTIAIVTIPAVAVSVILTDRVGRRPLLMISAGAMFFCCLLLGVSFTMLDQGHWKNVVPYLVYAGLTVYSISFSLGIAPLPWVIMSEIFPINIKGSGGSLVTLANWFGSWVVTYAFNFLFEWSSPGVFYIFACFCAANFLFIATLVPETKGRALEELQASLAHFK